MIRATFQTVFITGVLSVQLVGCSDGSDSSPPPEAPPAINPYSGYSSELYDSTEHWLCRPDLAGSENVCSQDLSATRIFADGTTQLELFEENENPPADCFYLYPTISRDPGLNSDFIPGLEPVAVYLQVARYRSVCNVYAPMHRQVPSGSLFDKGFEEAAKLAYSDALDAFKQFIANHNGRPFILVGHSQGVIYLIELIRQEIENDPYLLEHFVSAHLIGLTVERPLDAEVGGTFKALPPCTDDAATGCFVNYSSYYADAHPGDDAFFGRTDDPETRATCTFPVDLGSGPQYLEPYFTGVNFQPFENPADRAKITTPFFTLPDRVLGECVENNGIAYLAISVDDSPNDALVDNVGRADPTWGLHDSDIPLAQGNLVRLARRQVDTWLEAHRGSDE